MMETLRLLTALSLIGLGLCLWHGDRGAGYLYRLDIEHDATIVYNQNFYSELLDVMKTGQYPRHRKKRALMRFEDLPSECSRLEWAKMYVYFAQAFRENYQSVQDAPDFNRPIELYQVHKNWDPQFVTHTRRTRDGSWSSPFLNLNGSDAGPQVVDTQTIYTSRPPGFVEFDVTCAIMHRLGDGVNHGYLMKAENEDLVGREIRWYADRHADETKHAFINVLCNNPNSTQTEAQIRQRCEARNVDINSRTRTRNRAATVEQPANTERVAPPVDIYTRDWTSIPLNQFPQGAPQSCDDLLGFCPPTFPSTKRLLPHPTSSARYCSCRYCDNVGVTIRDMACATGTTFNFHLQECALPNDCGCS